MNAPLVTSSGPVSTGTVVWRARGVLYLTVVVKATFALVPEGRMNGCAPDPIAAGEQPEATGLGLRTAGDLAPYLGLPEVWLTGHAAVPPRSAQDTVHVQLAMVQDGVVRIDRQLDLAVAGAAGAAGGLAMVRIGGLGPIAADWPLRARWVEGVDPRRLREPVLDLPDGLHWEHFQTSPLGQRVEALRGDEWIVLGGMVAGRPRLRTQLPAARGVARLYRQAEAAPRDGEPVALRADTLQIDVDRLRCSILWRGRVQLAGEAELASLAVVGGLETAGQPVEWEDPLPAEPDEEPEPELPMSATPFSGTLGIPDDVAAMLAAQAAMPFDRASAPVVLAARPPAPRVERPAPDPFGNAPFGSTMAIPDDIAERLAAAMGSPFQKPRKPAAAAETPFQGTMGLPENLAAMLASAPAMPFQERKGPPVLAAARERAPGDDGPRLLFTGTMGLPDDMAERLAAMSATPFEQGKQARRAEEVPFGGTLTLPDDLVARLAAMAATPFEGGAGREAEAPSEAATLGTSPVRWERERVGLVAAKPAVFSVPTPSLPLVEEDDGLPLVGLGAEFLAAMTEAGAPG